MKLNKTAKIICGLIILTMVIVFLIFSIKNIVCPKIMINGEKEISISLNEEYFEQGAYLKKGEKKLSNSVNISGNVEKKPGSYTITYSCKYILFDIQEYRIVNVIDNKEPVLSLIGSPIVYLEKNVNYIEHGFSAIDDYDLDITSKVQVEKNIDITKPGTYYVKYNVSDSSNNKVEIQRRVIVVESFSDNKGVIYLTFDDGPSKLTTEILEILKKYNIKATFFVTKAGNDSVIKKAYDEGHSIGLHTYSHSYDKVYASIDNYFSDLNQISERVERITGEKSNIIRFPGGSSNTISRKYSKGIMSALTKEVLKRGYLYYDWNVSSEDASAKVTKELVYSSVINNIKLTKANYVLMHDAATKTHTKEALEDIINEALNRGYRFEKITELTPMITQRVNN